MINNSPYRSQMSCIAVLGSMTMALKAQRALAKNAIRANTVKVSRSSSKSGCIYGIEFDCPLLLGIREALDAAGIQVEEFLR